MSKIITLSESVYKKEYKLGSLFSVGLYVDSRMAFCQAWIDIAEEDVNEHFFNSKCIEDSIQESSTLEDCFSKLEHYLLKFSALA